VVVEGEGLFLGIDEISEVAKVGPSGRFVWRRRLGEFHIADITTDGTSLFAVGYCMLDCRMDPFVFEANQPVLFSLDSDGNLRWASQFPPSSLENRLERIAHDADGVFHVLGNAFGELEIGATMVGGAGVFTTFVARFDEAGTPLGVGAVAHSADRLVQGRDLALAGDGTAYVLGWFSSNVEISGKTFSPVARSRGFIARL
jgi:hypothetical protein